MTLQGVSQKVRWLKRAALVLMLPTLLAVPACTRSSGRPDQGSPVPLRVTELDGLWALSTDRMIRALGGPVGGTVIFTLSGRPVTLREALFPTAMHYAILRRTQGAAANIPAEFVRDAFESVILSAADQRIMADAVRSVMSGARRREVEATVEPLLKDLQGSMREIGDLLRAMGFSDAQIRELYLERLYAQEFLRRQQAFLASRIQEPTAAEIGAFYRQNRGRLFRIEPDAKSDAGVVYQTLPEAADAIRMNLLENAVAHAAAQQLNELRRKACLKIRPDFWGLVRRSRIETREIERTLHEGKIEMAPARDLVRGILGRDYSELGIRFPPPDAGCAPEPLIMDEFRDRDAGTDSDSGVVRKRGGA